MEEKLRNHYRRLLLDEKERILNTINKMKNTQEFGAMDEYYTELSFYDNHPADIGTEMFMMEQDKGLADKLNDTLVEIEYSLEAIDRGDYGKCISCGREIDKERLEVIPYLKLCINCSEEKIPLEKKMEFRPEEEGSISPFSNYKNNDDINGFDREDSYQEVERYNRIDRDPSFNTGDQLGVFDEDNSGAVEDVEEISQDYYKDTL
ncbi:MAG TPA: molecular chaperone DnaK [Tissierellia bacterium]|nr:molecular chaperone DnaK [Tissierellia bacterium]